MVLLKNKTKTYNQCTRFLKFYKSGWLNVC